MPVRRLRRGPRHLPMSSNFPEMLWLRAAARACLPSEISVTDTSEPEVVAPDWTRLLWLARVNRGLLFLAHGLAGGQLRLACPAEIRTSLDELRAVAHLQALARASEIARLGDVLQQHGVAWAVADDWMFTQCFAPDRPLAETTEAIQLLVREGDLPQARAALAIAGHREANRSFEVAALGHTPVKLVATVAAPQSVRGPSIAGRVLPRLPDAEWLHVLTHDHSPPPRFDLLRAWQTVYLAHAAGGAATAAPAVAEALNHSRRILGLPAPTDISTPLPAGAGGALPITPFVPTPEIVVKRMLALAETTAGDTVLDLGSGDGRVVLAAARDFGARASGIDRDPALIARAQEQAEQAGLGARARFLCADLFAADVTGASVICLYLLPPIYAPVRERLLRNARPGTRVVSHDYFFPDWPPEKTALVRTSPARMAQIYLWRIP